MRLCACLLLPGMRVKLKGSKQVASDHRASWQQGQNLNPEQPSRAWPLKSPPLMTSGFQWLHLMFQGGQMSLKWPWALKVILQRLDDFRTL